MIRLIVRGHISLREIGASSDFADLPINDTDKYNFYQNVSIGQVTLYVLSGTQLSNFRLPLQIELVIQKQTSNHTLTSAL